MYPLILLFVLFLLGQPLEMRAAPELLPPPDLTPYLTAAHLARLEKGEVVVQAGAPARGGTALAETVALVLIRAPADRVLEVLTDFERYPAWRDNTTSTRILRRQGDRFDVSFELSVPFNTIRYTAHYELNRSAGWLRWRLDPSKPRENIRDSIGAWVTRPVRQGTVLLYSIRIESDSALPAYLREIITKRSLPSSLEGVKRRVEGMPPRK